MAVPLNEVIATQTAQYLVGLDPTNPPSPQVIERELLEKVNEQIEVENVAHHKKNQIPMLKTLTNLMIADVLLRLHHVGRIPMAGENADKDYDIIGIYQADGPEAGIYATSDDSIRELARKYHGHLTKNDFTEVMLALRDKAPRRSKTMDRDLIAVNNGVFDFVNKQLLPHSPEFVFTAKSSVDYDPNAQDEPITMPDGQQWTVEQWVRDLSDDEGVPELIWEIFGAVIRPNVDWNLSASFVSEKGNNGKGTCIVVMRNLCGPRSHTSIPMTDWGKDFLLEPLVRATAVLVDENDVGTFIDKVANYKAAITHDVIGINRKFKTPITLRWYGFMVQCFNESPRIKDKSESFYRRMRIVPFKKSYQGIEREYIKSDYLNRPEVLRYILKRVLHMDYYKLSEPQVCADALDEYKVFNDPVRAFWEEFEPRFVWDFVPKAFAYDLYKAWQKAVNPDGSPLGKTTFLKHLEQVIAATGSPWWSHGKTQVRHKGRMSSPEPLIAEYNLEGWMNPMARGSNDPSKKCIPLLANLYTGFSRLGAGRVVLVEDAEDEDDLDAQDVG